MHVNGWQADGRAIYLNVRTSGKEHIWKYSFVDRTAKVFLQTDANEFGAEPSPDGRWVAYASDDSGRLEVYLRGAEGSARTQVSRDGGLGPRWSRDGRELFFRNADGTQLLSVRVDAGPEIHSGAPTIVFSVSMATTDREQSYAVSPDAKQFLILHREGNPPPGEIEVTANWSQELKRLVRAAPR